MVVGVNIIGYTVENRSTLPVDQVGPQPLPYGFALECDEVGCYRFDTKCINGRIVVYLIKTDHKNKKVIILKEHETDVDCNESPISHALVSWRKGWYKVASLLQDSNNNVEIIHIEIDPVDNLIQVVGRVITNIVSTRQTFANVIHPVERVFVTGFADPARIYEIDVNGNYYDTGVNNPVPGYFIRWHCYGPGKVYGGMHYWIVGAYSRIVVLDRYARSIRTIDQYESGCGMWHGSTPLPDGTWLWYGGSCAVGYGETKTWLKVDPGTETFTPIDVSGLDCGGNGKYAIYGGKSGGEDVILATCVEIGGSRVGAGVVTISGNIVNVLASRSVDTGVEIMWEFESRYWEGTNPPEIYNGNVYKMIAHTRDLSRMYFAEYTGIEEPWGLETGAPAGLIPTILKLSVNVMP